MDELLVLHPDLVHALVPNQLIEDHLELLQGLKHVLSYRPFILKIQQSHGLQMKMCERHLSENELDRLDPAPGRGLMNSGKLCESYYSVIIQLLCHFPVRPLYVTL